MQLRQSVRKIDLTGPRHAIRQTWAWLMAACAAVGAVGYLLPAHKLHGEWHSNYADGGPFSLVVLVLVLGATLALRHRRLGSGMLSGVVVTVGAIAALAPVVLAHMFSHVEHGVGDDLFALGAVGLVLGGVAMFLADPILYVLERRRLRREEPQFPIARALA